MMTRTMRRFIYGLFLVKLVFALTLFSLGYWYWLLNFELAFFSSMFIVFGSFHGYKTLVHKRLEAGEGADDNTVLEKIEDPYELYEESTESIQDDETDLAQVVKEEKARLKQNKESLKKTIKSTPGLFSAWRFIPYIILVLCFIGLNNNHILDITAFLIGLGFGIVSAIFIGIRSFNQ